jgi:homeodomain-containing protein
MPKKTYRVAWSAEERTTLEHLLRRGTAGTRKLARARILLKADDGLRDAESAAALEVGTATVGRTRQRFVEEHLGALDEHARPGAQRQWTGQPEAHVMAGACTPAPAGQARWTLRLRAAKVVARGFADSMAPETVRQGRKKTTCNRGNTSHGVCRTCVPSASPRWRTCWTCTRSPRIPVARRATVTTRVSH